MVLPGLEPPSVRLLARADTVHGRSPERLSTTVMFPNGIGVLANSVRPEFSASVPRFSGLDAVYGVLILRVPTGIVASMFCVSVHCEPVWAQAPVCGAWRMKFCGADCEVSN